MVDIKRIYQCTASNAEIEKAVAEGDMESCQKLMEDAMAMRAMATIPEVKKEAQWLIGIAYQRIAQLTLESVDPELESIANPLTDAATA